MLRSANGLKGNVKASGFVPLLQQRCFALFGKDIQQEPGRADGKMHGEEVMERERQALQQTGTPTHGTKPNGERPDFDEKLEKGNSMARSKGMDLPQIGRGESSQSADNAQNLRKGVESSGEAANLQGVTQGGTRPERKASGGPNVR